MKEKIDIFCFLKINQKINQRRILYLESYDTKVNLTDKLTGRLTDR